VLDACCFCWTALLALSACVDRHLDDLAWRCHFMEMQSVLFKEISRACQAGGKRSSLGLEF
jgi:hypothetical protein